nr:nucleotidyl transferase AbiEii/AbiGii toxin family protein [Colwellia maritima]
MLVLHKEGFLQHLTFIGGTSLRLCYNSNRLSEDLDFTGRV